MTSTPPRTRSGPNSCRDCGTSWEAERPRRRSQARPLTPTPPEKDGSTWVFHIAGSVPEIRTMHWQHAGFRPDAAARPYYVLRYRARGQRRDYQPLAVLALSGVDGKGKAVTVPLLDASEVINDDRWHVILGKMATAITAKSVEAQLSTVGSEATLEIGDCTPLRGDAESRGGVRSDGWTIAAKPASFAPSISRQCSMTTRRPPSSARSAPTGRSSTAANFRPAR